MADNHLVGQDADTAKVSSHPNQQQQVELNLENHCLFCLRPQHVQTLLEVAGRNLLLSKDPRPIIHYLTGTDPSYGRTDAELEEMGIPARTIFPPMMCPSCYDILAELYRLHEQLLEVQRMIQNQTELAREILINSQNAASSSSAISSRQQFYSKIQSSGMSGEEVAVIAKFVDNFYTSLVFEAAGNNKVKFPARLPPDMSSKTDENIDCLMGHPNPSSISAFSCINTSKSSTLDGSSTNSTIHSLHNNLGDFGVMQLPVAVEGLGSGVNVKHENEYEGNEKPGEELFKELDDLLESNINNMDSDPNLSTGKSDQDEEEQNEGNYSPSPSDKSSSSWAPSSPEPTTSKRTRKRKCDKTVKLTTKNSKVRKSDKNASGTSTSATTAEKKPHSNSTRKVIHRVREVLIRPLVVQGKSTFQHCDICGELCPSSEIKTHLVAQHHVQDFIKKCPNRTCPYVFSCQRKLDVHLSMPKVDKNKCRQKAKLKMCAPLKKCEICRFQTKYRKELERHLKAHEIAIPEKSMRCPIPECPGGKFGLRQSVEEHLYQHNAYNDHLIKPPPTWDYWVRKRRCDICSVKIPLEKMQNHLEETHKLKDYITKCLNPNCLFVFSCRGTMEKHLRYKDFRACREAANLSILPSSKKCETCNLEIGKVKFINHLHHHELQLKDKSMPCPIPSCPDRYALRQSVEEHLMIHDRRIAVGSKEQACSVCNQRLKMEDVEEHLKEVHEIEDVIRCRRCPFLFHDWETLLDHIGKHLPRKSGGGRGFFCDMCDEGDYASKVKFMRYEALRMHFFNVHKIGKEFRCEVCDKKFFLESSLFSHHKNMHSAKPQNDETPVMATKTKNTFDCDQCPDSDTRFTSKISLHNHKMQKHGAPPVTCGFCNKEFVSTHSLEKHQRVHMGLQPTYTCTVGNCGREYQNKTSWKNHERSHNEDPSLKQFVCDTCGKRFNVRQTLSGHIQRVHMGKKEPRIICDICGESFSTAASLRRHNLIHTGERPFQCTICGQAFRHRDVLNTHLKSHEKKGDSFKPNGPMKNVRKRVAAVATVTKDDQAE